LACVVCGREDGPMIPTGWSALGQIFRHPDCHYPPEGVNVE